ncbi:LrgB family protein [Psychrobacillus glaciei]|uniref:LrgB family protein n=1 Tax=Psychrobacillus glaciei TaxID=2283160 RepID=A0A5J6SQ92_9BACI|nr:LrgB family protein [Psychrobacillus glaciei]QFF98327.1 LrgB family protein [Psychrobacillus glaciei]
MAATGMILGTIFIYFLMRKINTRFTTPFLLPVLTTTILIIALLRFFSISYDSYMFGAKYINNMLGPAVVSLAYPLYMQRGLIKKYKFTILTSIIVAMFSGLFSIITFAKLLKMEDELVHSLLPKSITTPVAMQISESIGGNPTLTSAFVIVAGFTGALLGPIIFKIFCIETPISKGVSIGSASHGFGVSKLSEFGEQAFSMGSVSMTLSAVIGSFICPFIALFI